MSFLDWIANWAEENIPLVGSWIAELVRKLQGAIESAWGWIEKTVSYIKNTWIPWAETQLSSISNSLSNAWNRIKQHIEPAINALRGAYDWLNGELESLSREFSNLVSNLRQTIWDAIPDWLKNGAWKAIEEIPQLWNTLNTLWDGFWNWVNNADSWFQEKLHGAKSTIESWIHEVTDPIEEQIDDLERELDEFLDDPAGYIRDAVNPVISPISQKLEEFSSWVKEKVHGFIDAISSIDDFILYQLEKFIIGLIMWFIGTLIDDLAHLQYDPETKQVYGKPKNPITHILVWFFEVEKPENPYQSVKPRMGVKE